MTAARLSPAANLLRNSRLFALPSPIPLPSSGRYHDEYASDTATTAFPTRAALETPKSSLNRGDWGLKRALPIKTTTKTGTPTFRIRGGIDTPEHIADFESAADHVINLQKFQELNLRISLPDERRRGSKDNLSAFARDLDNTTDSALPATESRDSSTAWLRADKSHRAAMRPTHLQNVLDQFEKDHASDKQDETQSTAPSNVRLTHVEPGPAKRRWRYSGPYLAGITELEFNRFLQKITPEQNRAFRELVKEHMISQRVAEQRSKALDEGVTNDYVQSDIEVSQEEVSQHLRTLRSDPGQFGPLIASFFDLADGPDPEVGALNPWSYGRDTITANRYRQTGPPQTHPSAGLSYQQSGRFILNSAKDGPLEGRLPAAARVLQSSVVDESLAKPSIGVAGFVANNPNRMEVNNLRWEPTPGGPKCVVNADAAIVSQTGKLEIQASVKNNWHLERDEPVSDSERKGYDEKSATAANASPFRWQPSRRTRGGRVATDLDVAGEMDRLERSSSSHYNSDNHV